VGCIGTLVHDASGLAIAGLSVSAPIERRRDEWIPVVMETAAQISKQLGYHAA
jgi:DNA-binding IclR family transcriptional regulator